MHYPFLFLTLNLFLLTLVLLLQHFENFYLNYQFLIKPSYISPCCIACNGCIFLIWKPDNVAPINPITRNTIAKVLVVPNVKWNGIPSGARTENICLSAPESNNAITVIINICVHIILNKVLVLTPIAFKIPKKTTFSTFIIKKKIPNNMPLILTKNKKIKLSDNCSPL